MEAADAVASGAEEVGGPQARRPLPRPPRLQVGALLAGPVGWLVIGYLGSLAVLLVAAFWSVDALSGELEQSFTPRQLQDARRRAVYRTIALRTIADRGRW